MENFFGISSTRTIHHIHICHPLTPSITTQSQASTTTPPTTTVPTITNGTTSKERTIQALHDRCVETELQHIQAINNQTTAIRELAASIKILVTSINNQVVK